MKNLPAAISYVGTQTEAGKPVVMVFYDDVTQQQFTMTPPCNLVSLEDRVIALREGRKPSSVVAILVIALIWILVIIGIACAHYL